MLSSTGGLLLRDNRLDSIATQGTSNSGLLINSNNSNNKKLLQVSIDLPLSLEGNLLNWFNDSTISFLLLLNIVLLLLHQFLAKCVEGPKYLASDRTAIFIKKDGNIFIIQTFHVFQNNNLLLFHRKR